MNVTSVQSRLSGLCTLLIEVATNIDSIWNMWICGVGDSVDQSAIAQTGLHGLRFLALVKHHVQCSCLVKLLNPAIDA